MRTALSSGVSRRAQEITPFLVMDILERAKELERAGEHVIHLEIGEPDYDTPQVVKDAAYRAMAAGETQYTHSQGLLELRQALCQHYRDKYRVTVTPEQFIVTSGTSPAMLLIFGALLDPGDEVLLPDPHYACYPNVLKLVDAVPRYVPVTEEDGFQSGPGGLGPHLSARTKAILINSPGNPTGTLISPELDGPPGGIGSPPHLRRDLPRPGVRRPGALDPRIHRPGLCDQRFFQALRHDRLAPGLPHRPHGVYPAAAEIDAEFLHLGQLLCAAGRHCRPDPGGAEIEAMRLAYDARRRFLLAGLARLGFRIPVPPTGAFYVFVNARHLSADSYALAFDILEKAKVGVTPGIDFGPGGEGFLRFSYANSLENLAEALRRLETYLAQRLPA